MRNLSICTRIISAHAIPAHIEYKTAGTELDEDRARATAAQVKEWRERGALYLPNLPKEKIAELRGSPDYPPKGSPGGTATPVLPPA